MTAKAVAGPDAAHEINPLPPGPDPVARTQVRLALIDILLSPGAGATRLPDIARQTFTQAAYLALEPDWSVQDEQHALALARGSEAILLITRNAGFLPRQVALAERLAGLGIPLIIAAVRNPAVDMFEMLDATIVRTYGDPPVSLRALLETCRSVLA